MYCQNCGSQEFDILPDGAGRCRYCGNIIPGMGRPAPGAFQQTFNNVGTNFQTGRKDKVIALVLTFFLGGFGIQYFYLGRPVAGIINLIFFWTFIPCIWSLVFFIILLCMSDQQFDAEYNNPYKR